MRDDVAYITGTVCGALAVLAFTLVLLPQIVLNYRRKSTHGLSTLMVVLWHIDVLCFLPYIFYRKLHISILIQFIALLISSVIIEVQIALYSTPPLSPLKVAGVGALSCSISGAAIFGLLGLFEALEGSPVHDKVVFIIGSGGASLFFAAGFIPQALTICQRKSSEGYSLGLTFLQVVGSVLAIGSIVLTTPGEVGGLIPYLIAISFQVVIFVLAVVIYPARKPPTISEVKLMSDDKDEKHLAEEAKAVYGEVVASPLVVVVNQE